MNPRLEIIQPVPNEHLLSSLESETAAARGTTLRRILDGVDALGPIVTADAFSPEARLFAKYSQSVSLLTSAQDRPPSFISSDDFNAINKLKGLIFAVVNDPRADMGWLHSATAFMVGDVPAGGWTGFKRRATGVISRQELPEANPVMVWLQKQFLNGDNSLSTNSVIAAFAAQTFLGLAVAYSFGRQADFYADQEEKLLGGEVKAIDKGAKAAERLLEKKQGKIWEMAHRDVAMTNPEILEGLETTLGGRRDELQTVSASGLRRVMPEIARLADRRAKVSGKVEQGRTHLEVARLSAQVMALGADSRMSQANAFRRYGRVLQERLLLRVSAIETMAAIMANARAGLYEVSLHQEQAAFSNLVETTRNRLLAIDPDSLPQLTF